MSWKFWERWTKKPGLDMQAQPIYVNVGNELAIKRNRMRIARLKRAIEKGLGTPAIEAELLAREKAHSSIVSSVTGRC